MGATSGLSATVVGATGGLSASAARRTASIGTPRPGATLTEVLMAILIMGLGIVPIFSLFPLSIVRSIKATQKTNATLFKENILDGIRRNPEVLYQHAPTVVTVSGNIHGQTWRPSFEYQVTDVVSPPSRISGGLVPPLYVMAGVDQESAGPIPVPMRSALYPPIWLLPRKWPEPFGDLYPLVPLASIASYNLDPTRPNPGPPAFPAPPPAFLPLGVSTEESPVPGEATQAHFDWVPFPGHFVNPNANGYVIDPLGWWTSFEEFGIEAASNQFGKRAARDGVTPTSGVGNLSEAYWSSTDNVPGWGAAAVGTHLPRINSGILLRNAVGAVNVPGSLTAARATAAFRDTWLARESIAPTNSTVVAVALPVDPANTIDLELPRNYNDVPLVGSGSRVIVTTEDGRSFTTSAYRIMANSPYVIRLTVPASFIDAGGNPLVTNVRFESSDLRYSWLATVNNSTPGVSKLTVAIMFNRKFTLGEEHVYKAVWGNSNAYYNAIGLGAPWNDVVDVSTVTDLSAADAFDGTNDGSLGGLTADQVVIAWNSTTEPTPVVAEGDYLFDAINVDWYQVTDVGDVVSVPPITGATKYVLLNLNKPVRQPTLNRNASLPKSGIGRAILMRGVVEIFEP